MLYILLSIKHPISVYKQETIASKLQYIFYNNIYKTFGKNALLENIKLKKGVGWFLKP